VKLNIENMQRQKGNI